ncbi:Protein phosphatase 4 core regulatory subunit R2 [Penicillium malachiteum]|uniref:Protein phosphatase 4 core regulatory subunit R2 n=1 Tax=Penicillium malachiteum TaxID=1324776 RepID=A0AAD6HE75_9EURO|nr:Protein phosphatase 4 core regulatory subunit R2 [Penicillium malachiteum]
MSLDEAALEVVANGGSIDVEKWAGMVPPILERLEYIVYNVFPMPKLPPTPPNQPPFSQTSTQPEDSSMVPPESSNKENAAPEESQTSSATAPVATSPSTTERVPDSQPQASSQQTVDGLPQPLALLLKSARAAINSFFVDKPPHTIQRFAELILHPTAHYRTLPAYLRAVDRVVSVTSGADIFPFNTPATTDYSNGLLHPTNSAGTYLPPDYAHGLGSDESLGGALLTPIPWLTTASFDSADSSALEIGESSHLDTQQVGGGAAATVASTIEGEDAPATVTSPTAESDEVPHARGPSVLGVEDLGLQNGKGVEMNLEAQQIASADGANDEAPANLGASTEAKTDIESNPADKDGDIVLEDTKPAQEEDTKMDETTTTQAGAEKSEATAAPSAETAKE